MPGFEQVRNVPGVYLLTDLDDRALYAGRSLRVRTRLQQHFIRQNSSATADGLLDLYDVLCVYVWYCDAVDLVAFETAIYSTHNPRWNRAVPRYEGTLPDVRLDTVDSVIGILDQPEQLAVRRDLLERTEAKLLHLLRAVRKARISGASPEIHMALQAHAQELIDLLKRAS
jgi:hypothetical protein